MMKQVHAPEKISCCKSQQPKSCRFGPREFDFRAEDSDLSDNKPLHSLPKFNLMDLPLHPPMQPKLAAGNTGSGREGGDNVIDPEAPVVQRYVKVGLYEGSLGMDHIGVGVNSEKTKGFSPKAGQGQEAEKGSWVEGEVKEDHDLIDSLTIRTNPQQEARLQTAINRSESSSQKFHLYQHNCAQHGAQILNSADLGVRSSPMPRAFFEGLKRQYEPGQEAKGQPVQGKFEANAPTAEPVRSEPNRTGMPDGLKAGIEALSRIDMSDVRVHANSDRPAKLNALAYTQGNQIYLGTGQERHLAHEAWHAVQQKQGRVRATGQMNGLAVNDDVGLEREAYAKGIEIQCRIPKQIAITNKEHPPQNGHHNIFQAMKRSAATQSSAKRMSMKRQKHLKDYGVATDGNGLYSLPMKAQNNPYSSVPNTRPLELTAYGGTRERGTGIESMKGEYGEERPDPNRGPIVVVSSPKKNLWSWADPQSTLNIVEDPDMVKVSTDNPNISDLSLEGKYREMQASIVINAKVLDPTSQITSDNIERLFRRAWMNYLRQHNKDPKDYNPFINDSSNGVLKDIFQMIAEYEQGRRVPATP